MRDTPVTVAWITGASSGIGRALALRLSRDGYHVAATARRTDELAALARQGEGRIVAYPGDITDIAAMRELFGRIERECGPVELAVLNAGYYRSDHRAFVAADVRRTIDINLCGTVNCLEPLLAAMVGRRKGRIAIVASLAGYGGVPGSVAYASSKAALITLAEALRLTHRSDGVVVQVVNPGFVDTAMTASNRYAMPMMMSADAAAHRIARGLRGSAFEITFPLPLAAVTKAASLLPYRIWFAAMAAATRRVGRHPTASHSRSRNKSDAS